jgi:DNA recombination protein RmuC
VAQAGQAFLAEREHTLRAAVDSATQVATSKLDDSMRAGNRELDLRSRSFEQQVQHIGDALGTLGTLVHQLQKERAEQTGSLVAQLEQVSRTQQSLAEHTAQLRQALASPKQRGQWGERMAEDVLRAAGFREGVNYRRQRAVEGGTIPDFRFLLPSDLELRMDVKFPVDNYLRVLEADDDEIRARHTRAFVADVRGHVRGLASRGYIDHCDTVDCLLLFIPNEAVYAFLHEADPDVVDVALGQRVVLCSPSTLFAVLAVVRRSVEQFQLERRSDEILRCLAGVSAEWDKLTDSLDKVGRQLDTVHRSFHDELNGTRRRVFQRRLDEIEALPAGDPAPSPGDALAAQKAAGDVRPLAG